MTTIGWQRGPRMQNRPAILFASVLALGLVLAGCSKSKDSPLEVNLDAGSSNQVALNSGGPAAENNTPQIRDLQASVDAYVKIYQRKPVSLEQLVKEGFLAALPAPPPGKKYAFDSSTARVSVVPR